MRPPSLPKRIGAQPINLSDKKTRPARSEVGNTKSLGEIKRGQLIHSSSDHLGTILVTDYMGFRSLNFNSEFTQSGYNLAKPYAVAHEYIRIMLLALGLITPKRVLILGLGGGSILRSLHRHLERCIFTAVELRSRVLSVSQDYFDLPMDNRVHYICQDALGFIQQGQQGSVDIIFADLFDAYLMHPTQAQPEFLVQCLRLLSTDGCLAINFHQLPAPRSVFFTSLKQLFPTVLVVSGDAGNHVVLASKKTQWCLQEATGKITRLEEELDTCFASVLSKLQHSVSEATL